jgi:hypothetical protein
MRALFQRAREALLVLIGRRPATVRYDEIEHAIADACAFGVADFIVSSKSGLIEPLDDLTADHGLVRRVAVEVRRAIEMYVTYPVGHERTLRRAAAYKAARPASSLPELNEVTDMKPGIKRLMVAWKVLRGDLLAVSAEELHHAAGIATTLLTSQAFGLFGPLDDQDSEVERWERVHAGIRNVMQHYFIDRAYREGFAYPSWEEVKAEARSY